MVNIERKSMRPKNNLKACSFGLLLVILLTLLVAACGDTVANTVTSTTVAAESVKPTVTQIVPTETFAAPATTTAAPTLALNTTAAATTPGKTSRATSANFENAPCPYKKLDKNLMEGKNLQCGYLTVPEEHAKPNGKTIKLPVAIVKSSGQAKSEPLFLLQGGPGGVVSSVLDAFSTRNYSNYKLQQDYDMVFLDQRGTFYAQPSLYCTEQDENFYENLTKNFSHAEEESLNAGQLARCRDRLQGQGINLSAYNTAENAADVNALRLALGYDKINLYGVSYGTRLALTVMRDFPEGLRSVILDSTVPLEVDIVADTTVNFDRAFNKLFQACTASSICKSNFSNLAKAFSEIVANLNAKPITLKVVEKDSGKTWDVLATGDNLVGTISQLLYSSPLIPYLPALINDIGQGNYKFWETLLSFIIFEDRTTSRGMYYSVQCGEEVAFTTSDAINKAGAKVLPELKTTLLRGELSNLDICKSWPAKKADPKENKAVVSNIPTLVAAGEFDPITPPTYGKLVAAKLKNSYYVEFPGTGHGALLGQACPVSVLQSFLSTPTTKPDSACTAQMKLNILATTPSSTVSSIKEGKPNTVPDYPNGKQYTLSEAFGKQFAASLGTAVANANLITFISKDKPEDIFSFYQDKLKAAGYSSVAGSNKTSQFGDLPLKVTGFLRNNAELVILEVIGPFAKEDFILFGDPALEKEMKVGETLIIIVSGTLK